MRRRLSDAQVANKIETETNIEHRDLFVSLCLSIDVA